MFWQQERQLGSEERGTGPPSGRTTAPVVVTVHDHATDFSTETKCVIGSWLRGDTVNALGEGGGHDTLDEIRPSGASRGLGSGELLPPRPRGRQRDRAVAGCGGRNTAEAPARVGMDAAGGRADRDRRRSGPGGCGGGLGEGAADGHRQLRLRLCAAGGRPRGAEVHHGRDGHGHPEPCRYPGHHLRGRRRDHPARHGPGRHESAGTAERAARSGGGFADPDDSRELRVVGRVRSGLRTGAADLARPARRDDAE